MSGDGETEPLVVADEATSVRGPPENVGEYSDDANNGGDSSGNNEEEAETEDDEDEDEDEDECRVCRGPAEDG